MKKFIECSLIALGFAVLICLHPDCAVSSALSTVCFCAAYGTMFTLAYSCK